MCNWEKLQKVDIGSNEELCKSCNTNLTDIASFIFKDEIHAEPKYWQELCECRSCGTKFVMHYDIFDSGGHIYQRIFSEDINNEQYSWTEDLNKEQKKEISDHLENCEICKERLAQEQLAEALVNDFMKSLRKKLKGRK